MSKAIKKEIYLVVSYSFGDMNGVFKAYESKDTAKEVVRIKQKESQNTLWQVLPVHLVLQSYNREASIEA